MHHASMACMHHMHMQQCSTTYNHTRARTNDSQCTRPTHASSLGDLYDTPCCSGAFKFRGACNSVFALSDDEADKGVVTHRWG